MSAGTAPEELPMIHKNKLLSILSDAEQEALYGLPDFDDGQRLEFLSLSETELALAGSRLGLHASSTGSVKSGTAALSSSATGPVA